MNKKDDSHEKELIKKENKKDFHDELNDFKEELEELKKKFFWLEKAQSDLANEQSDLAKSLNKYKKELDEFKKKVKIDNYNIRRKQEIIEFNINQLYNKLEKEKKILEAYSNQRKDE